MGLDLGRSVKGPLVSLRNVMGGWGCNAPREFGGGADGNRRDDTWSTDGTQNPSIESSSTLSSQVSFAFSSILPLVNPSDDDAGGTREGKYRTIRLSNAVQHSNKGESIPRLSRGSKEIPASGSRTGGLQGTLAKT